jgi:hypothetical protein
MDFPSDLPEEYISAVVHTNGNDDCKNYADLRSRADGYVVFMIG